MKKKHLKSINQIPKIRRATKKIFDKHFNQNIGTYDLAYRVSVYTMRRTAATNIYKKFGIVHAKRFLNHTEIDTTMKYLNIDDYYGGYRLWVMMNLEKTNFLKDTKYTRIENFKPQNLHIVWFEMAGRNKEVRNTANTCDDRRSSEN